MMPVEEWKKEWSVIDSVIGKLDLGLENVEADRCAIDSLLDKGEYVVHHSKVFEDTYSPPYRIIRGFLMFVHLWEREVESVFGKLVIEPFVHIEV